MTFDPEFAWSIVPDLILAAIVNVQAAVAGFAIALLLGLPLAVSRVSRLPVFAGLAAAYVEIIRGTPFLIQLFFIFYVLPAYGIQVDPLLTGILALGLNYATYTSEVYRAGIESIPRVQWEAALALSLSSRRTWSRIVLPQAVPPVMPVLGSILIGMFKDSAILATISVVELLNTSLTIGTQTFRYLEALSIASILFLLMSLTAAGLVRILETRLRPT